MPSITSSNNSVTKSSSKKIRFGLVGAGAIAQSYVQAFENCEEAVLVAVADTRAQAAKAVADRVGCASFDGVERMVAGTQLDAAIVCTPPASHPEICIHLAH